MNEKQKKAYAEILATVRYMAESDLTGHDENFKEVHEGQYTPEDVNVALGKFIEMIDQAALK